MLSALAFLATAYGLAAIAMAIFLSIDAYRHAAWRRRPGQLLLAILVAGIAWPGMLAFIVYDRRREAAKG